MRPVIGIPLRYTHLEDGRAILYLSEKVRRTLQKAGGEVFSLVPVQDLDYMNTKGNEFPKLTAEEKIQIHKNLDTIPPDFYTLCFKKMCLGQVMIWIANIRSKYENLSTPFGQLPLNWMKLQEDGQRLLEEANQFLASIPPDKLIEVFD